MLKLFTKHPASVNQSYWAHFLFAFSFGLSMLKGGLACMLHALLPFIFQTTGSQTAFSAVEKYLKERQAKTKVDKELLGCLLKRKEAIESDKNPNKK